MKLALFCLMNWTPKIIGVRGMGGGGGQPAPPSIFWKAISGKKVNNYSEKTTWFLGKQWGKYSGKRLQPPPPPERSGPVRLYFLYALNI